ncbi:MAG: hypothetical protein ACU0CO_05910 [Shimia sp.]
MGLNLQAMQLGAQARKLAMAGGTFAVAMGVGFFMQQQNARAAYEPAPIPVLEGSTALTPGFPATASLRSGRDLPEAEAPAPQPAPAEALLASLATPETAAPAPMATEAVAEPVQVAAAPATRRADSAACEPFMAARAAPAAMVELLLSAPCNSNETFTVHHEGMMFSAETDLAGNATVQAPALSRDAIFIAAFDSGIGALAETEVGDLDAYDRVVLQWQGPAGFEVHAMEDGANYGEPGHVWRETPRDAATAAAGAGGFLTQLGADGDKARNAEVYTIARASGGDVGLSVEAAVTLSNCAQEVDAQTLQRTGGATLRIRDLSLPLPGCEAIGEYLVLKNLLEDLTLAG